MVFFYQANTTLCLRHSNTPDVLGGWRRVIPGLGWIEVVHIERPMLISFKDGRPDLGKVLWAREATPEVLAQAKENGEVVAVEGGEYGVLRREVRKRRRPFGGWEAISEAVEPHGEIVTFRGQNEPPDDYPLLEGEVLFSLTESGVTWLRVKLESPKVSSTVED